MPFETGDPRARKAGRQGGLKVHRGPKASGSKVRGAHPFTTTDWDHCCFQWQQVLIHRVDALDEKCMVVHIPESICARLGANDQVPVHQRGDYPPKWLTDEILAQQEQERADDVVEIKEWEHEPIFQT